MAIVTLKPTSATSSTSWTNASYVYDGSATTGATVSCTSSTYTNYALTLPFDTSSIPSGATINSATLYVVYKQSSSTSTRRYTPYLDINGSSSNRVISSQLTNTSSTTNSADITSYISTLTSVLLTPYRAGTSGSNTLTVYEVYIDVDYTVATVTSNIYVGDNKAIDLFLGSTRIIKAYLGDFLLYSYGTSESGGGNEPSNIAISLVSGRELDITTGTVGSASTDAVTDLIALTAGTYTFACTSTCEWLGYAIYNYDTEAYETGKDIYQEAATGLNISFTLTGPKKVRLGANIENCDIAAFTLTTTDGGLV